MPLRVPNQPTRRCSQLPKPCGSPAGPGRPLWPPHSAWPPGRSWPGRRRYRARRRSPCGPLASTGRCRPGAAVCRPWPRPGGPGRWRGRAGPGTVPSRAGCPTGHRPCRPRGTCAVRTSPTGSPRPPGARSRWCPGRPPPSTPRSEGAGRPGGPGGRRRGSCRHSRARPPRRKARSPKRVGPRQSAPSSTGRNAPKGPVRRAGASPVPSFLPDRP